jgi:hypothetical protein
VTISSSGWPANDTLTVFTNDTIGNTWSDTGHPTTDANGELTYTVTLPNYFIASYTATAKDAYGLSATTGFTDAVNLTILGSSDGATQHTSLINEEDLGSVALGSSLSLTCPRGTGLVAKGNGLGNGQTVSWSVGYVAADGDDNTLAPKTTYAASGPNSGTFTSSSGTACLAPSISTTGLTVGTTYHGHLQLVRTAGVTANPGDYFFKFMVTSGTQATSAALSLHAGTNPSTYGDLLTFRAAVSPTPTGGTVEFKDGGSDISGCAAVAVSGGIADCTTSALTAGTHANITAVYGGTTGFTGSTSSALSQTVNVKPVTVTPNSGQSKVFGQSDPTLTFTNDGGLALGAFTGGLSRASGEDVGAYAITLGTLSAGSNYSLSLSGTEVDFVISRAATTTTATPSASSILYNGMLTVGYTVSAASGVSGNNATGTVAVVTDSAPLGGSLSCIDNEGLPTVTPALSSAEGSGGFTFTANGSTNVAKRFTCIPTLPGSYIYHLIFTDTDGGYKASSSTPVSTLTVSYAFTGFLSPLDPSPTVWNMGNAGRTYPIKWQLKDVNGAYITTAVPGTTISVSHVTCPNGSAVTDVIDYAADTGGTSLRYDSTANQYVYNWASPSAKNTCYQMTVTTPDGQVHLALFSLK